MCDALDRRVTGQSPPTKLGHFHLNEVFKIKKKIVNKRG